mgnify:CR=1 FL=1
MVFLFGISINACTDSQYLFMGKQEQQLIQDNRQALKGTWKVQNGKDELVLQVNEDEESLILHSPSGKQEIRLIENWSALGLVIKVKDGENEKSIMAQFKTYERSTLTLMNVNEVNLGVNAQRFPLTFKKIKEETVLTASSQND